MECISVGFFVVKIGGVPNAVRRDFVGGIHHNPHVEHDWEHVEEAYFELDDQMLQIR